AGRSRFQGAAFLGERSEGGPDMHRAGQRLLGPALAVGWLLVGSPALAFHAGNVFDLPPGSGGGGGKFYVRSPHERGWTCTACHLDAQLKTRVSATSDPPGLFTGSHYTPSQTYTLTLSLDNEYLGMSATRSNYNSLVLTVIVDDDSKDPGTFSGYT